uniref:MFS domain-containing protein n=1 Tax=Angiostrongylus cantonensis TaxID=6313 RepID=A0A158P7D4_ANGCA
MFYGVTRFHLVVLLTNLSAGLLNSQLIFAIFSNYAPKWQCGLFKTKKTFAGNLNIFPNKKNFMVADQYGYREFGWLCSDDAYMMSTFSQVQFVGVLIGKTLKLYLCRQFGSMSACRFANSWQVLHLVRFLLGLCIGGCLVTVGTFITELLLPDQRMLLRGVFNWGVVRLILTIVCMLVPEWRSASIVNAMFVLPAIVSIIFIFPESPTWLHSKTFCEMWSTPGLFRRLGVLWLMWFMAAYSSYSNDLNSNTISGNLSLNVLFLSILLQILLAIDTWLPMFSRRRLHHGAQFVVCMCFLTMFLIQGVGVLLVNLIGCVFIEYTWDACFLCAVESLETPCRASGTGSCSLTARIGAISTPFLTYMNSFWPPSVYFSVFVLGSINLIVSYMFLIETKGVNLDDVNILSAEFAEMDDFSSKHKPPVETDVSPIQCYE